MRSLILLLKMRGKIRFFSQSEIKFCLKLQRSPLLRNDLGDKDESIIFTGQCQSKGKEKKEKRFDVQLKYEVLMHCLGQKQSAQCQMSADRCQRWLIATLMSATSLPGQFDLGISSACTGPAFFSCEMCTQGSIPSSFAAVSVVKNTW